MSDVKLSRRALAQALADYAQRGVVRGNGGNLEIFTAAAQALLAVMEPAGYETCSAYAEGDANQRGLEGGAWNRYRDAHMDGWRAAEARARRVAGWEEEP